MVAPAFLQFSPKHQPHTCRHPAFSVTLQKVSRTLPNHLYQIHFSFLSFHFTMTSPIVDSRLLLTPSFAGRFSKIPNNFGADPKTIHSLEADESYIPLTSLVRPPVAIPGTCSTFNPTPPGCAKALRVPASQLYHKSLATNSCHAKFVWSHVLESNPVVFGC